MGIEQVRLRYLRLLAVTAGFLAFGPHAVAEDWVALETWHLSSLECGRSPGVDVAPPPDGDTTNGHFLVSYTIQPDLEDVPWCDSSVTTASYRIATFSRAKGLSLVYELPGDKHVEHGVPRLFRFSDGSAVGVAVTWYSLFSSPYRDVFAMRSIDDGLTWGARARLSDDLTPPVWFSRVVVRIPGTETLVFIAEGGAECFDWFPCEPGTEVSCAVSHNGGQTWQAQPDVPFYEFRVCDLDAYAGPEGRVVLAIEFQPPEDDAPQQIYVLSTTDAGQTWTGPTRIESNAALLRSPKVWMDSVGQWRLSARDGTWQPRCFVAINNEATAWVETGTGEFTCDCSDVTPECSELRNANIHLAGDYDGFGVLDWAPFEDGYLVGLATWLENGLALRSPNYELMLAYVVRGRHHDADSNWNWRIDLSELLRVIQFYQAGYQCDDETEDGFAVGPGDQTCTPHGGDYNAPYWHMDLRELMRAIQFFNAGGFRPEEGVTEDGFAPDSGGMEE